MIQSTIRPNEIEGLAPADGLDDTSGSFLDVSLDPTFIWDGSSDFAEDVIYENWWKDCVSTTDLEPDPTFLVSPTQAHQASDCTEPSLSTACTTESFDGGNNSGEDFAQKRPLSSLESEENTNQEVWLHSDYAPLMGATNYSSCWIPDESHPRKKRQCPTNESGQGISYNSTQESVGLTFDTREDKSLPEEAYTNNMHSSSFSSQCSSSTSSTKSRKKSRKKLKSSGVVSSTSCDISHMTQWLASPTAAQALMWQQQMAMLAATQFSLMMYYQYPSLWTEQMQQQMNNFAALQMNASQSFPSANFWTPVIMQEAVAESVPNVVEQQDSNAFESSRVDEFDPVA